MATPRLCVIPGCGKPQRTSKGWCQQHLHRWNKYGDPLAGRTFRGAPLLYFQNVVLAYVGDDCLTWPFSRSSNGYAIMRIKGKTGSVSRLVCTTINGEPVPPLDETAHSCGRGHLACVSPQHVRWATRTENQADRLLHGTDNGGERCGLAKLTNLQAEEVRRLKGLMTQREIGARFGLSAQSVSAIQTRKTYR